MSVQFVYLTNFIAALAQGAMFPGGKHRPWRGRRPRELVFSRTGGVGNAQGANRTGQLMKHAAFIICGWPMLLKNGWPMLVKYAEANAFNSSGTHNEGGLGPPLAK